MEKIFIDKNINVYFGKEAEPFLSERNDSEYIKDNAIIQVDKTRWTEAQSYERKTWMENNLNTSDDRNFEHYERFDSYSILTKDININQIESVIELGCGPFTNLRTISKKFPNLKEVHLLDPLLNDYLNHPNCFYKNCKFENFNSYCYNTPIEEFEINQKFDLVIMNNVLEHCFDIDLIFKKIDSMLKTGGVFIFSDVYFNDVQNLVSSIFDAGHPLRISEDKINFFIKDYEVLYEKRFKGLYSQDWRNDLYFIGKKK